MLRPELFGSNGFFLTFVGRGLRLNTFYIVGIKDGEVNFAVIERVIEARIVYLRRGDAVIVVSPHIVVIIYISACAYAAVCVHVACLSESKVLVVVITCGYHGSMACVERLVAVVQPFVLRKVTTVVDDVAGIYYETYSVGKYFFRGVFLNFGYSLISGLRAGL